MQHVDRFEDGDRAIGRILRASLESHANPLTLMEICERLRYPLPVSHNDLAALAKLCGRYDIRSNMDDEAPVLTATGGNWSYLRSL